MKKFLLYATMFSVCIGLCACEKNTEQKPEDESYEVVIPEEYMRGNSDDGIEGNFEDGDIADISTDGCFIVLLIGSREMTAYDLQDEQSSIYTYDLDDLALGEWKSTKTFDMCHYRWHQLGTTSPENWYLIKPTADDYEITFTGKPYVVTYNDTEYRDSDYESSERYGGYFVLTPNGVDRRATEVDEATTDKEYEFAKEIAFDDYIIVSVKEITEPFEENINFFDDKTDSEIDTVNLCDYSLGQWLYTETFSVCKVGYEYIDGDAYSYYAISLDDDTTVMIYSLCSESVYFYGTNNEYNYRNFDPYSDSWVNRGGWFAVSKDGVGWEEMPILFNEEN